MRGDVKNKSWFASFFIENERRLCGFQRIESAKTLGNQGIGPLVQLRMKSSTCLLDPPPVSGLLLLQIQPHESPDVRRRRASRIRPIGKRNDFQTRLSGQFQAQASE